MTPSIYFIVLVIVLGTLTLGWSCSRRQQYKYTTAPGRSSHRVPLPGKHVIALRTRLGSALLALSFAGLTLLLFPHPHALAARAQKLNNLGSYLTTGQYLSTGDYLESANGQYFATMQSDGNFCVYHGSGPSNNLGGIWCVRYVALPTGQYFAIMQDDGNFVVYHGSGPSNNQGLVWATNTYLSTSIVAGNGQSQFLNDQEGFSEKTALFAPLQVKVSYANGTPGSKINVSFKVGSAPSGMQVQYTYEILPWTATVTTDANGIATLSWVDQSNFNSYSVACYPGPGASTVYQAAGPFTIVASIPGYGQVTFNETVTA